MREGAVVLMRRNGAIIIIHALHLATTMTEVESAGVVPASTIAFEVDGRWTAMDLDAGWRWMWTMDSISGC